MPTTTTHPFNGRYDGDLAENAHFRVNPRAAQFGHNFPDDATGNKFNIAPLPRHLREMPDHMVTNPPGLVECQGAVRSRGYVTVKPRKVDSLMEWLHFAKVPVSLFVYFNDTDEYLFVPVDVLPELMVGLRRGTYKDGTEYVQVPIASFPCVPVPVPVDDAQRRADTAFADYMRDVMMWGLVR